MAVANVGSDESRPVDCTDGVEKVQMSREDKLEKVQRLRTAHNRTRQLLEDEPVTRELHAGTDIARNWTVITAAYCGLEQTIKYLLANEKDLTISKLIGLKEEKRYPYKTHDLSRLCAKLSKKTQDVIGEFYERFQSLHSFIPIDSAPEFLKEISAKDGKGYERWRYTLIEDMGLPRNSPEALVSVWGVCIQIALAKEWKNQQVRFPDEMLTWKLRDCLDVAIQQVSLDRQNTGELFQNIAPEKKDWLWNRGHPLNAFANVLWNLSRYGEHGQAEVSEWLSDALVRWGNVIQKNPAISRPTSLRAFVTRAQGRTPQGQSIRWNQNSNRFEPVPWSLSSREQDALPSNAIAIVDPIPQGMPLRDLWLAAKESGYFVLESRRCNGSTNQAPWFRTHEVRAASDDDSRLILTMWRERNADDDIYYMVEEQPRNAMAEPVRRWIEWELRKQELVNRLR